MYICIRVEVCTCMTNMPHHEYMHHTHACQEVSEVQYYATENGLRYIVSYNGHYYHIPLTDTKLPMDPDEPDLYRQIEANSASYDQITV